jgi:hypothetical protein
MLLEKFNPLKNDIIIVDGLWGTGKSLLGPIVSGMDRVEKAKLEHIYEYVAILRYLDKISPDAAAWMLKTYADLSQYNNLIGREVNLRWSDDSGLANNPNSFQYIKRMFGNEGDQKLVDINDNNIALNVMSHMLLLVADPIFEAYGERAKIIEIVRHPLYMVKHWYSYLQRFDSPREFTVSFNYRGNKVPWFVVGWEDEFIKANMMNKALLSIIRLYAWLDDSIEKAAAKGNSVLTFSFEAMAMTPDEPLQLLESFLGRRHYPRLSAILRKQKIPRRTISQGKGHAAYGWSKDSTKSEEQVYAQHFEFVRENGSSANVDKLQQLIETYNDKYPSILAQYQ